MADIITHDQIAEDGVLDPLTEGFEDLIPIVEAAEEAITNFAKNTAAYLKGVNLDNLDLEGLKELEDRLAGVNTVTEQSVKLDRLKAQSAQAAANAERAQTAAASAKIKLEQQSQTQQQKSIVLTKEQIAQKQIDAQKDRDAIALIKAKLQANDQTIGSLQRVTAQSTALRLERAKLDTTTSEGKARLLEINQSLDENSKYIIENSDQLKKQAMNVGNYTKSFQHSLRPIEELVRGISYALGVPIEGLREYTGVIRGVTHFTEEAKKKKEEAAKASEKEAAATEEATVATEGQTVASEESAVAMELSVPIIGAVFIALAALVIGLETYSEGVDTARKRQKLLNTANDGTILLNEKLSESWDEAVSKIEELSNKYNTLMGKMSEYSQSSNTITQKYSETRQKALKEYEKAINDIGITDKLRYSESGKYADLAAEKKAAADLAYMIATVAAAKEENEEIDILGREQEKTRAEADMNLKNTLLDQQLEFSKSKNALIRNDFERENKDALQTKNIEEQKLGNQIKFLEDFHKQDSDYTQKHEELLSKQASIEEVYNQVKKKRNEDYARANVKQMLAEYDEAAKLSKDKLAIAEADYKKAQNETDTNANLTPEQRLQADANNAAAYHEQIYQISRAHELKEQELRKSHDALILDSYVKETESAKTAYDIEVSAFKDKLRNFDISQAEYDQHVLDSKKELDEKLFQADLKDKERREAAGLNHGQNEAESTLKEAQINNAGYSELYKAKTAKNKADEAAALQKSQNEQSEAYHTIESTATDLQTQTDPDKIEADKKAVEDAHKDLEAAEKDEADTKKQFHDNQLALDKDYRNQIIDEAIKAEEALTNALAEGLQKRAEMQQQADQITIDKHQRLMEVQAALAAGGRANSLAQEEADTERAEEKKQQDAIRAQKVQQGIQLAQIMLQLTATYAKQGINSPELKALAETLAAKGLAAAISGGYAEGVEGLDGPGDGKSDSILARLSKGESVITADGTSETPGLATAINERGALGAMDWAMQQYSASNMTRSKVNYESDATLPLINEIKELRKDINSKPVQQTNLGRLGEWTEVLHKDNQRITINHIRRGGRSRL